MQLCDYGCGQEANHQLKNGKWCCCKNIASCLKIRKKISEMKMGKKREPFSEEWKKNLGKSKKGKKLPPFTEEHLKNMSISLKGKNTGPKSEEHKNKIGKANKRKKKPPFSEEHKKNLSKSKKFNLKDYKEKYPFFFKIEELRETKNGEIQGHCKNHNCKNSKEKGGWFTLTYNQLKGRKDHICNSDGNGGHYFYCSQHCKDTCPLYNLHGDPYRDTNLPYTPGEYQACRAVVFERENGLCEYCGEPATDMHHIFPVKLEPFFALDPDYCVACCEKHHYKYAHKDECNTGNLAKIVCSVKSQKFLD